jgi:hypothetical protein
VREVTSFVIVFPSRLACVTVEAKRRLLEALGRGYPHYTFKPMDGRALEDEEEFGVIPIVGSAGNDVGEPDTIFMCRPLDPRVIPDLTRALRHLEVTSTLN